MAEHPYLEQHKLDKDAVLNVYLHMSGRAEGIVEAGGDACFPMLFANAILEITRKSWVGLSFDDETECLAAGNTHGWKGVMKKTEEKLKEKNYEQT